MAERKSLTITWKIKNFSFCWQKKEEELAGPTFFIDGMEGSKWTLCLFPQATISKEKGDIAFYFYLEKEENGAPKVEIDYELSVLGCTGLPLASVSFAKSELQANDWSSPLLLLKRTVFLEKPDEFLTKDSLTVRCKMWQTNQENINSERYFANTRIEIEKVSIFGVLKKYDDYLYKKETYYVQFISVSAETSPIFINLRFINGTPNAIITPESYELMKFCKCELHFTDDTGKEILYGKDEFLFHFDWIPLEGSIPIWNIPLRTDDNSSTHIRLNDSRTYDFPEPYPKLENLTLRCEVTYSIGITSEKFEKVDYSVSTFLNGSCLKEKQQKHLPNLKDDMLALMTDADSCDTQLKTENKTFPAHSIILSARSLFFRNKIDKKNPIKTIYVADLDDETLSKMLLFLYTDTLENLESKGAMNLYNASERYGIPSLKLRCSLFLQNNIDASICCEALKSADQYQDSDLKKATLNYILEHVDEVIGSDKWQDLECFTELTEEVLFLKRMRN